MSVFVIAVIVFVVIIYFVYMLSLPVQADMKDLPGIFYFLAIFQWITASIIMCSILLYIKRIHLMSPQYGKVVLFEAIVFIFSNLAAGGFNFWLGKGQILTLVSY